MYFCATGPTILSGPDRMCYKSLDGGKTFTEISPAIDDARGQKGWTPHGAIGTDGTLYVPHVSSQGLAISVSKDEGDSWNDIFVTDSVITGTYSTTANWLSMNVATDDDDNLYAVWVDDRDLLPYLSVSKDQGARWSKPSMVGAPGVLFVKYPSIAVKKPGYVAIAYYGSLQAGGPIAGYFNTDNLPYNAYLAVTTDLFADDPLLWSAMINPADSPVIVGMTAMVSEYIGPPAFAPDGSVWAAFLQNGNGLAGRIIFR